MLLITKLSTISNQLLVGNDPIGIAKNLLGKYLVSQIDGSTRIGRIVETEAYKAPEDMASHAYRNKRTTRTSTMFLEGGISYIYLCYGIHNMLNVVTGENETAHAVLIRAVEPLIGIEDMKVLRKNNSLKMLCNGPGKLCQAFGITRHHNALDLCTKKSPIWIGVNPTNDIEIISGPRVGVAYAKEWAQKPWRFYIKDNEWVSDPKVVVY